MMVRGMCGLLSVLLLCVLLSASVLADGCAMEQSCPVASYVDGDFAAWHHDAFHFCIDEGLIHGEDGDTLQPDAPVTRAMLCTVLWRQEGMPVVNYLMQFPDFSQEEWYSEALRWAAAMGIVAGETDGMLYPNEPLSRQDMATILYRYVQHKGEGFVGMWMFRLNYSDVADIAEYAYEPLCWMSMHKIMQGEDGCLKPQAIATRAEMAQAVYNLLRE